MKRLDENNRTEKFWTATVLASLIADNQFAGVPAFLNLLKDSSGNIIFNKSNSNETIKIDDFKEDNWGYENFQISTELWHSRDFSKSKEYAVPDIILLLKNKYLIVCEAKLFQRVKVEKIEEQIYLQKQTIKDILNTHEQIEFVHHDFIYGGSEKFTKIKGVDSIITWENIFKEFQSARGKESYFVKVLAHGLEKYKKEFPEHTKQETYYSDTLDFIDLLALCGVRQNEVFVGIGTAGTAEHTLNTLITGIKEELNILKEEHKKNPNKFKYRPEFLKEEKYKYQSALEYLFKHSNQPYKIDDVIEGSGDDKSQNPKWIDGYSFIQKLKNLIK